MNLILIAFSIMALIILVGYYIRNKNPKYNIITPRSFEKPRLLDLDDCGKIFRVAEVGKGEIKIRHMHLSTYRSGNNLIEKLLPTDWSMDWWYLSTNIPPKFRKKKKIFEIKNVNGELVFSKYTGTMNKITPLYLKQ